MADPKISKACDLAVYFATVVSVGYDQSNRWDVRDGGETDCSALVISVLDMAGFDVGEATYTGNMREQLTKRGWVAVPYRGLWQCQKGDILLNEACHTAIVVSGSGETAMLVQASIDENGHISGGAAGDQTGNETNMRQVYEYSRGWDYILRYYGSKETETPSVLNVDGSIGPLTVSEWQRQCGTTVDGVISGQLSWCAEAFPALTSVEYGFGGSELVARVQEIVGVENATGMMARGTVSGIQKWLYLHGYSCEGDEAGVIGKSTAKALQKSLNDGAWND